MQRLRRYLSVQGKLTRGEYWRSYVGPYLLSEIFIAYVSPVDYFPLAITGVFILWSAPLIAGGVRRCHDRGRSGWFQLAYLIPIFGQIWVVAELWFLPSRDGAAIA